LIISKLQTPSLPPTALRVGKAQLVMADIFGSSDDSSDDEAPPSVAPSSSSVPKAKAALSSSDSDSDSSSSSGSDSDSDASPSPQNKRRRLQQGKKGKKGKLAAKKRLQRKPGAGGAGAKKEKAPKRDGESSDEYDSDEVTETAQDRTFIDNDLDSDDELGLKEAYGGKQKFDDERPDDFRKASKRDDREEVVDEAKKNAMDRALDALKVGRARKKGSSGLTSAEVEEAVQNFLSGMDGAYKADQRARKEGKVALEKVKFLPTVVKMLGRRDTFIKQLLECDFLGLIRKWLHPLSDGALPSFQVRSQVLAALHKMPDLAGEEMVGYLRRSEIGKTLMLLWKHKDEHTQNKTLIRELVERWSRPVLHKTADYRMATKRKRAQQADEEPRAQQRQQASSSVTSGRVDLERRKAVDNSAVETVYGAVVSDRVVIPKPMAFDFKRRVSQSEVSAKAPMYASNSGRDKMSKRMKDLRRPKMGGAGAIKMSVEGRGL